MSLKNCIPDLIAEGKIKQGDGARAERAYDRHYNRLRHEMGDAAAAAEASRLALDELDYEDALKDRQTGLQIVAQRRMREQMASYKGDPYRAAAALLGSDAKAPYASVEAQHKAVLGRIHARMEGVLAKHSRNLLGEARDRTGLDDLVRERFGQKTGNREAAELAEAFGEAADYARQRFNRAGGAIGKRQDWGLPQSHDMMKVRAVPYEQWRADMLDGIDLARMIDDSTGLPFTQEGIEDALKASYEAIRSDGWVRRNPGGQTGAGKLANRRADHRFYVFRDADAWLAYQEKYGSGTAYDAMVSHADGMARDIALMEVLGPNPKASLRWLQDGLMKEAATDAGAGGTLLDKARGQEKALGDLYDVVSGGLNSPVNELWARRMGGTRAFLTSTHLGSAVISAITDVGFQAVTRAYNGLPIAGAVSGYLKTFSVLGGAERKRLAVRLGLIAEEAAHMAASLNRYVDGTHGPEAMMRLSDGVLRVSGLSTWTQVGRWAFGMETLGMLADVRAQGFDALDPALRGMLERYGIDAAGWEAIRATEPYRHRGAEFLRPDDVADEALGDALLRMVLTETDYAVPSATARSRATLSFGQRPGTLGGEALRNVALFKNFGVSMILTHGARMMEGTAWSRIKYAAGLTATTTLLGALANQLNEIRDGRDPAPMNNGAFWWKAALRGGGFGIFGDFVGGATSNRFGGGLAETIGGPVVSLVSDVARAGAKAIGGNPGGAATDLLRRYTPGGSLWYARTAYNRMLVDTLQQWADPNYARSWGRMERAARDRGTDYYWGPGESAPDRAPDVANAWAGEVPD